jgi:hypothetical protein
MVPSGTFDSAVFAAWSLLTFAPAMSLSCLRACLSDFSEQQPASSPAVKTAYINDLIFMILFFISCGRRFANSVI